MKYLKGFKKKYFSLKAIVIYSALHKLKCIDSNFQYHIQAFKVNEYNKDPPID
jgi:hypothetical protein